MASSAGSTSKPQSPIIDTRGTEEYVAKHIRNAYSIPLDELGQRSYELPPRYLAFRVVTTAAKRGECEAWFVSHNVPWPVEEYLVWEYLPGIRPLARTDPSLPNDIVDPTQSAESEALPFVQNITRHYDDSGMPIFPFAPAPLLCREINFLRRVLNGISVSHPGGGQLIVDVGCGAGRDTIFLAHAFRDHHVLALDNLQRAIQRVEEFAKREGLPNVIPFRAALKGKRTLVEAVDCAMRSNGGGRGGVASEEARKKKRYGVVQGNNCMLILMSRYLNREIFDDVVQLLRPGGYVLIHHFLLSCTKPKQAHHKIKPGELAQALSQRGLQVLSDDVFVAPDDGRELSMFVARKPENSRDTVTYQLK